MEEEDVSRTDVLGMRAVLRFTAAELSSTNCLSRVEWFRIRFTEPLAAIESALGRESNTEGRQLWRAVDACVFAAPQLPVTLIHALQPPRNDTCRLCGQRKMCHASVHLDDQRLPLGNKCAVLLGAWLDFCAQVRRVLLEPPDDSRAAEYVVRLDAALEDVMVAHSKK